MNEDKIYHSPTLGELSFNDLMKGLIDFMAEDPKRKYDIVIGTDSQERNGNGNKVADFITAIVIHRVGRGGRYFWKRANEESLATLRDRIYKEVMFSLDTAQEFIDNLQKFKLNPNYYIPEYEFEIHVDIGENGKTRDMINEVVGMIRGNGFNAKIKPEAYGATKVADRHT